MLAWLSGRGAIPREDLSGEWLVPSSADEAARLLVTGRRRADCAGGSALGEGERVPCLHSFSGCQVQCEDIQVSKRSPYL